MTILSFATRLPVLRRLIPSAQKRIAALTWAGDFRVVRSNGATFLVNYKNFVDRQIAFLGDYETAQHTYFLDQMTLRGCDMFIDVGANIGLYTVLVARRSPTARIVAFEPDPRNYDQLRANLLLNGLTDRVETHKLAVSDRSTVAFKLASARSTGESKVDEADPAATSMQAARLDDLLPLADRSLFLKIDIEGHEIHALQGMAELLRRNRCFLQVESFEDRRPQVELFMKETGYALTKTISNDLFFSNI